MKPLSEFSSATTPTGGLSLRDVRMHYGKGDSLVQAVKGVTLDVSPGEMMMLKGPSGSGKTTLLQLMGALKQPTHGEVRISNKSTTGLSTAKLREMRLSKIGFVFQFFNLFPTLNAWENIALVLSLKQGRDSDAEKKSRLLLAKFGLEARANFMPQQLSGGQRQRVAIARALALEPEILLADEPTAALDGESGEIVITQLRRCAKEEGRTVVVVSHDQRIEHAMDRIATLEDGRITSMTSRQEALQALEPVPVPVPAPAPTLTQILGA